jgi:hypothetical protein
MTDTTDEQLRLSVTDHARHEFLNAVSSVQPQCPKDLSDLLPAFRESGAVGRTSQISREKLYLEAGQSLLKDLDIWADKYHLHCTTEQWVRDWALCTLDRWTRSKEARRRLRWKLLRAAQWTPATSKFEFAPADVTFGESRADARSRIDKAFAEFITRELDSFYSKLEAAFGVAENRSKLRFRAYYLALHQVVGVGAGRAISLSSPFNIPINDVSKIQAKKEIRQGIKELSQLIGLQLRELKPGAPRKT